MAFVLERKDGESIVIHHEGETMEFQVNRRRGKTTLKFVAPQSFSILRKESVKDSGRSFEIKAPAGRDTLDCYVQTGPEAHYESGEVLSYEETPKGRSYHVRLSTGRVIKRCEEHRVKIVQQECQESFGSERHLNGSDQPLLVRGQAG